jgi:hypothetical protein
MSGNNCVLVLVDESSAMSAVMRDKLADGTESTKTNAARVATSINNLLRQLADGPACDVALVGYRSNAEGEADVGCRWLDGLAGREFVSSGDLHAAARSETRTRRVPQSDGSFSEEPVSFSVWYEPVLGAKAPQIAAFRFCRDLLGRWKAAGGSIGGQPLIMHVFSGASADGSPQMVVDEILQTAGADGKPIIVQCHMAASSSLVTTAFPSKQAYLASGMSRDLFGRASELPHAMQDTLKAAKVKVQAAGRALVHNAKIVDLFHCMQLAKQHVAGNVGGSSFAVTTAPISTPGASPVATISPVATADVSPLVTTTPASGATSSADGTQPTDSQPADPQPVTTASPGSHAGEAVGLAVLVLDRSVADPFGGSLVNPCSRLQEAANEILKQLSTKQCLDLAIDTAIVSYGLGSDGQPDVRSAFDGPLAGRAFVRNTELPAGAIRVEEAETQVSNGAGGIVTINKKTPIYFDVEPASGSSPQPAFAAAAAIIGEWCGQHPTGRAPMILHLTRGSQDPAEITAAAAEVSSLHTSAGPVLIHNLVITESPHKALSYPDSAADIDGEGLKALWEASSPLPGWERLKEGKRPYLTAASRGFVVNGKFDALADEFNTALAPA